MAPHSSTLAWKIPWMEKPGRLQSMGSLRVRHDRATSLSLFTFMHWRRLWQPTPAFLPGESQGRGSLVGCRLWGRTESVTTEATWQQQQHSSCCASPKWPPTTPAPSWSWALQKGITWQQASPGREEHLRDAALSPSVSVVISTAVTLVPHSRNHPFTHCSEYLPCAECCLPHICHFRSFSE